MKILIVSQRYWPENFRISDIASELVKRGNEVTVLTGLPNYPQGYIFAEYKHGKNRKEEHEGVHIIRAFEIARRHNHLSRFLNYYSFPFFGCRAIKKLDEDYDVVIVNELSPIMGCKPGIKYKKKNGAKVLMYGMDLWPESLLAGGIKKDGLIYKYYKNVAAKIYSQCDKVLVSTREHIDFIRRLPGCDHLDVSYLPQYAEAIFEMVPPVLHQPKDTFDLMFAGNIGKAQSVLTIIKAAKILENNQGIVFHIVGDGSEKKRCEQFANDMGLSNVVFYGNQPLSQMPAFYQMADVMLATLENSSYANLTIPGKIQGYMAMAKPIIASANGSTAALIRESKSGFAVPAENAEALAETILKAKNMSLATFGQNGRNYYLSSFRKELFFQVLIEECEKLVRKN